MGIIGLIYTLIKFNWVAKQDAGTPRMKEISNYIAEGAMAFLKAEWKVLGYFVVIVAILLAVMKTNELVVQAGAVTVVEAATSVAVPI